MKKLFKIILSTVCAAALTIPVFATACGSKDDDKKDDNNGEQHVHVDYAGQLKLDFESETKKQEAIVRLYVDGDTTHFEPVRNSQLQGCDNRDDFYADDWVTTGYAKARYLAINTPESTGQIEEWGKAASKFTRSKLENATSIIIESNDENWNLDSTGGRYLLWVWYKPEGSTEYRNLNIDILQEGLAFASGIPDTRYAKTAQAAIDQAEVEKRYVFSDDKDPDYHYGGPINTDLLELRFNPEEYEGKKVRVEGLVVANFNNTAYIEEVYYNIEGYEDGIRIGMPVYYSYTKGKVVTDILKVGNRVSVVGVLQFYETAGYYQITDIKAYDRYQTSENCDIIEEVGIDDAYTEVNPAQFVSKDECVSWELEKLNDEGNTYLDKVSITYAEALLGSSVTFTNLFVTNVSTTRNEDSSNYGAMTLTCKAPDGSTIQVRTAVFKDENGDLVTASAYLNKTITVKGVVEYYESIYNDIPYQIKCHRQDYITVL